MTIRGWCPGVHEPMATGDGMLVRVKPRGGVLTASEARLVAALAASLGNGVLELTSRGNLQVRGLSPDGVAPFARAIVAAGLASGDAAAERRRNVIATPLADLDPAAHPATGAITVGLETALEADAALAALPAKFGFLVDGGGILPLAAPGSPRRDDGVGADVRLHLSAGHAEIACDDDVSFVSLDDAVQATLGRARAVCLSLRGRAGRSPGGRGFQGSAIGPVGGIAFGAGLPFGSATAPVWSALADLAERYGDGKVRLTPWRAVLIAAPPAIQSALADLGLITDADDPRLRVCACPGQPGCASATVATRAIASPLRPASGTIHVSGCDKGCAHPGPASITLVGRDGRFDVVHDGRASDAPVRRGLSPAEALAL